MLLANRDRVGQSLGFLSVALDHFILQVAVPKLPAGVEWVSLLAGGNPAAQQPDAHDVRLQLRLLLEPVGAFGFLCEDDLTGTAIRLAGEMKQVADRWSTGDQFDSEDASRALETCERLLRSLGADEQADSVRAIGDASPLELPDEPQANTDEQALHQARSEPVSMVDDVAKQNPIAIEFAATPVLSYAIAHNRVPVIRELSVRNVMTTVRGARLHIEVDDADGAVGAPTQLLLDLEPGSDTRFSAIDFVLDAGAMLQIEERRPGKIRVRLFVEDEEIASASMDVWLLAANQWLSVPPSLSLEMLAAFVMPNHPAITALMSEVADELAATTGNASIQGYQAGPERVDQIAAAIVSVMHGRGIRYSEPPASWADAGQKVRTPGDVLDGRVGTCLDTVVVMAAAFEQAGIRPLLWVVESHAFLGYWREERSLAATAQTDVTDVVNLVDLGLIRLIETTLVTKPMESLSMEKAHRLPYDAYLAGNLSRVLGVNDVYRARKDGIYPLPARRRADDGTMVVMEYRPAVQPAQTQPLGVPVAVNRPEGQPRPPAPPRVGQWKNALLDLSLRNRLINFPDSARINLTVPAEQLARFEDAVNQGTSFQLVASDQIAEVHRARGLRFGRELPLDQITELLMEKRTVFTDLTEVTYSSRLRNLAYSAKTVMEETGANNLYLAFGSLLWNVEGRPLRSPLILVPVHLTAPSRQGGYRLSLDEAGASTPNYCLLEKLRQLNGLEIPGLVEPLADGAGIDLDAALQATRESLATAGLPFRVEPTVDLAILQFAKFRLWKDLDEHWDHFSANPLVKHLIFSPTEPFVDPVDAPATPDLDLLAAESPMPADSSQLAAVAEANALRTFVLEGPPGTGKSQTITNLLTRAIVDGKRVLFVAEKRAALDVVQKRLDAVGLGPFCLDLHDKGSKPVVVRAQIREALEHVVDVDAQGLAADLDLLSSSRGSLIRYARRLHEKNAAGLSFYSARTQLLTSSEDLPAFPVPESFVQGCDPEEMIRIRGILAHLPEVADAAHPGKLHPWGFIDRNDAPGLDLDDVRDAALVFDAAVRDLPRDGQLAEVIKAIRSPDELAVVSTLISATPISLAVLDASRTADWNAAASALVKDIATFVATPHPGMDSVQPSVFDLPLAEIHAAAIAAADSGFFGRGKRQEAVRDRLAPHLLPGARVDAKQVPELTEKLLQIQATVAGFVSSAGAIPGVTLPSDWNPWSAEGKASVERQVQWLDWAGSVVDPEHQGERLPMVLALRSFLERREIVAPDDIAAIARASATCQSFITTCKASRESIYDWSGEIGLVARWEQTRPERRLEVERLPALQAWLRLIDHLEPLRALHLNDARLAMLTGEIPADEAVRAFERGIAETSLRERASSTGLDTFDSNLQMRTVNRFTGASSAVRQHLLTAVPAQVLGARTYDASAMAGQVGLLKRQLARQRGGMGVRSLMIHFGDLIPSIMPCVLVSPDSVARFFPAKADLFDIVVFDEASQIRVADAVGAMGRGRAVVVVGDSKQMPPTSFAEPSSGVDDFSESDVEIVEDEESILTESVQARVPRQWLSWHYRSQDEALIAFSNLHYYENKLSSFPAPIQGAADPGIDGHGISLIRVDGQFHRSGKGKLLRTNPIEAEAVVAEIRRRFAASPDRLPSLGVVTFNAQQRSFIEALLRDSGDPRIIEALDDAADGLFVKNLENVQGDERDAIFFSTGFSVNERGYLPLNFGPLNRAGGERRLNVAITRARRQVIVFSSFAPELLRSEETSSVGVKHLRAYLDLAAQGTNSLPRDVRRRILPDRHRDEIADAFRARGYAVRTDVGLSEFKVDLSLALIDAPEEPVMAILLDGPGWAARRTVGDRDGLPTDVLHNLLHWPAVERIWMPAWLENRDDVIAHIEAQFTLATERMHEMDAERAKLDAHETPIVSPDSAIPDRERNSVGVENDVDSLLRGDTFGSRDEGAGSAPIAASYSGLPGAEVFVPFSPRSLGGIDVLDALPGMQSRRIVAAALAEVVDEEGPVHFERLVKIVASSFGLARVSEVRSAAILRNLDPTLRPDAHEPIAWPLRLDPQSWTGFRLAQNGNDRPLEHICRREIANAMVALCVASAGMSEEELKRETLRLFNGRRMTTNVSSLLDRAVAFGLSSNRLQQDQDGNLVAAR